MLARCMDVRVRRVAVSVVAVVTVLAAPPAVLTSSAPPAAPPGFASAGHPVAAPASADQFAIQVLDSAPVPPGAQPWTAAPPAVLNGWMSVAVSGLVDLDALYLVNDPGLTGLLDNWVAEHLPRGATESGYGEFGSPSGDAEGFTVSLPTSGPNEYLAQLEYETTEAGGGAYVLRIDAQVVWVPDRSGSERIPLPAGAELTGYTTLSLANPSSGPVSVQLGEAAGARLAAAVNALPLAPETVCAEGSLLFTITFQPPAFSPNPTYSVSEDSCGSTVSVSESTGQLPALRDSGCSLRRLVASLLPPPAVGTRGSVAYCQPG